MAVTRRRLTRQNRVAPSANEGVNRHYRQPSGHRGAVPETIADLMQPPFDVRRDRPSAKQPGLYGIGPDIEPTRQLATDFCSNCGDDLRHVDLFRSEAACWAHARRYFYDIYLSAKQSPLAHTPPLVRRFAEDAWSGNTDLGGVGVSEPLRRVSGGLEFLSRSAGSLLEISRLDANLK